MSYLIIIGLVILDQLSKFFATTYLTKVATVPLWEDVFHLTYATNTGAAFSLFRGNATLLAIGTSLVILGLLIFHYREFKNKPMGFMQLGLILVIGGAIGNFIDRVRLGFVVDYFDFRLIDFAIFNVADSFIVVGAILFGIMVLFFPNKG